MNEHRVSVPLVSIDFDEPTGRLMMGVDGVEVSSPANIRLLTDLSPRDAIALGSALLRSGRRRLAAGPGGPSGPERSEQS